MLLTSIFAGALAGAILLLFSHLAPLVGAGNFIRDLDNPRMFGKVMTRREGHFLGILMHMLISAWFGGLYYVLVMLGIFSGYEFVPIFGWGIVMSLFVGGVILPFEGHGIFGVKEDAWFPVDLFLTNIAWSVMFWWILNLWKTVVLA